MWVEVAAPPSKTVASEAPPRISREMRTRRARGRRDIITFPFKRAAMLLRARGFKVCGRRRTVMRQRSCRGVTPARRSYSCWDHKPGRAAREYGPRQYRTQAGTPGVYQRPAQNLFCDCSGGDLQGRTGQNESLSNDSGPNWRQLQAQLAEVLKRLQELEARPPQDGQTSHQPPNGLMERYFGS